MPEIDGNKRAASANGEEMCAYFATICLVVVDQTCTTVCDADARYAPLADNARAVIEPEALALENVCCLFQSERRIVTMSAAKVSPVWHFFVAISRHTTSTRRHKEIIARSMPYGRAIVGRSFFDVNDCSDDAWDCGFLW
jgi:hypothetical protein